MRIARKLMLLALTAIAAMAFAASSASALDTVEVVNEKTGVHCDTDVSKGCTVHAEGVATLRVDLGIFGEAFEATCNLETDLKFSKTGQGQVVKVTKSPGDANCTNDASSVVVECNLPWTGGGEEDGTTGVVQSSVNVCLNPAESSSDCVGALAFNVVEQAGEHYETQFNNASVGLCELDVDLEVEDDGSAADNVPHVNHP